MSTRDRVGDAPDGNSNGHLTGSAQSQSHESTRCPVALAAANAACPPPTYHQIPDAAEELLGLTSHCLSPPLHPFTNFRFKCWVCNYRCDRLSDFKKHLVKHPVLANEKLAMLSLWRCRCPGVKGLKCMRGTLSCKSCEALRPLANAIPLPLQPNPQCDPVAQHNAASLREQYLSKWDPDTDNLRNGIDALFRAQGHIRIFPSISQQSLREVAETLVKLASYTDTEIGFLLLISLPALLLSWRATRRGRDISKIIKERIEALWTNPPSSLVPTPESSRGPPPRSTPASRLTLVERMVRKGLRGKAMKLLTSSGIAAVGNDTAQKFRNKFYDGEPDPKEDDPSPQWTTQLTRETVQEALQKSPRGSAAGPSGWTTDLMLSMTRIPGLEDEVLEAIRKTLISVDKWPRSFNDGRGIPANKGTDDIRPIVIPEAFRRLLARCSLISHKDTISNTFCKFHQFGVGCKCGNEVAVHSLRRVTKKDLIGIKLDCHNAFNSATRTALKEGNAKRLPVLSPIFHSTYKGSQRIYLGNEKHFSISRGGMQGDPIMPPTFAAAIAAVDEKLEPLKLPARIFFLDDAFLLATMDAFLPALAIVIETLRELGIELTFNGKNKGVLYSDTPINYDPDHQYAAVASKFVVKSWGELEFLGTPIGTAEFNRNFVNEVINEVEKDIKLLRDLHPQIAYQLLRDCASISRINHIMRTVDPSEIEQELYRFDEIMARALEEILGGPLTSTALAQARLPISKGGLGLRSAAEHCNAAFVASASYANERIETFNPGLRLEEDTALLRCVSYLKLTNIEIPEKCTQRHISRNITALKIEELLATIDLQDKARFLSASASESFSWLVAAPNKANGADLEGSQFTIYLRFYLGLTVYQQDGPCPACGEQGTDSLGHHAVMCAAGPERTRRHNYIRDTYADFAKKAGMGPLTEVQIPAQENSSIKLDVVQMNAFPSPIAVDIGVTDPRRSDYCEPASRIVGYSADAYAQVKIDLEEDPCARKGWRFFPLVVETLGKWNTTSVTTIANLAQLLARRTGAPLKPTIRGMMTQLGLALVKGIANQLLSHDTSLGVYPSQPLDVFPSMGQSQDN